MFNLSQNDVVDRPILKCDYIRLTPLLVFLVKRENNENFIDIPKEDRANSLKGSYLELDFNVTHRTGGHARYADGHHVTLVNLGPIAVFNLYRCTSSNDKETGEIDQLSCYLCKVKINIK